MYNFMVLYLTWSAKKAAKKHSVVSVAGKLCHPPEAQTEVRVSLDASLVAVAG